MNNPIYHTLGNDGYIPFQMRDECLPTRWNVRVVRTLDACASIECANEMLGEEAVAESDYIHGWGRGSMGGAAAPSRRRERGMRGLARSGRVIGAEGARGGKRLGVGWRD